MRRAVVHCGNDALFGADHKRMIKKLLLSCLRSRGYDLVKRTTNDRTSAEDSPPRVHYPPTLWLEKHGIGTILDIGANEGDFAITMASRFPEARIVSFEPLADAFATLVRRTACQPRCRAMQCAIGDSEGEVEIQRCSYSPSSSILPMNDRHRTAFPFTAGASAAERTRVRRLDDVASELDLQDDIFVKIDVQGFEGHVVRGGSATLRRARVVIAETSFVPLYDGAPTFDDIYRAFRDLGFTYAGNWDQLLDPVTAQPLQADAIFIR